MSTTEAFNALVCEFADDLRSTFDEHQCLELMHTSLKKMVDLNKATPLPVCVFQSVLGGIPEEKILARDFVLLETLDNLLTTLGVNVDVRADYLSADELTKDAIWQYVTRLRSMSSSLEGSGEAETIDLSSMETIMASVTTMDPARAEEIMASVMSLVPPGLKEFIDEKVLECQGQLESGDLSTEDIMHQIKASVGQLNN